MNEINDKIAVVYLAWLPYGVEHFRMFVQSYLEYPAGQAHILVVALNGSGNEDTGMAKDYVGCVVENKINNVKFLYFESGQDIEIYSQVSTQINAGFFLFLNTYSRFRSAGWLKYYLQNWKEDVGLIGATGSYASYFTAIRTRLKFDLKSSKGLKFKVDELKYFLKLFFFYRDKFGKFPSPHIRTNAFFSSKAIFSSLEKENIKNKMSAYFFENGKNSMTAQVQKAGYRCILIDKHGNPYDVPEWPGSKLFWSGNQENLLISDNQTRRYEQLSLPEKEMHRKIAWGKKA